MGNSRFESLQGVQRHLLKHSHVSNSRSSLSTSPSQDEDRDKQLKQSGAHFNPLPILFARINSPSRPTNKSESRTNMEEQRVYKKKVTGAGVTQATLYYYCNQLHSNTSSGTGRILQQSRLQASWWLYREHFGADDTERQTHFTLPRQDVITPLCWNAHFYWTLTLLPNCENSKAKLSEKQVLLQISAVD